jgi:hypothetical protein
MEFVLTNVAEEKSINEKAIENLPAGNNPVPTG